MKIIINLSERQIKKAAYLSAGSDADVEKIADALPKYPEIDITDTIDEIDDAKLAIAAFALAAIANLEDS